MSDLGRAVIFDMQIYGHPGKVKRTPAGLSNRYLWVGSRSGPQHFYPNWFQNFVTWLCLHAKGVGGPDLAEKVVYGSWGIGLLTMVTGITPQET